MKLITLILGVTIFLNTFAGEAVRLFKTQGTTLQGEVCAYSIILNSNWEGQIVMLLTDSKKSFKAEFKASFFKNGVLVPSTSMATLEKKDNTILYTTSSAQNKNQSTVIFIKYISEKGLINLIKPKAIKALSPGKELNCIFKY